MFQFYKTFNKVKKIGLYFSGVFVLIMMFFIVADVFKRTLFDSSILGSFEFVQYYFMPLAVFPAIAYTYGSGIMPRIDMYITRLNEKIQRITAVILLIFELILFILLTYFGGKYALMNFTEMLGFTAGGKSFLYSPVVLFVPLGMGLVCIEIILLLIKNIKGDKVSFKLIED